MADKRMQFTWDPIALAAHAQPAKLPTIGVLGTAELHPFVGHSSLLL